LGFLEALTLILVVLKLTTVIDYSWWVVCSPLIGALALYLTIFAGCFAVTIYANSTYSRCRT
jgi:hypothetical protein